MAAPRLCRADAGKMIDLLNKVSDLMEDIGLEDGEVTFEKDGSYYTRFNLNDNENELFITVEEDGKLEAVRYRD